MIFKRELLALIFDGDKTETRRPIKDGEFLATVRLKPLGMVKVLYQANGRPRYIQWTPRSRKTYAAQPGRGKRSRGRIRFANILPERLQAITRAGVHAEGFATREEFIATWDMIYHPPYRWVDNPLVWRFIIEPAPGTRGSSVSA